MSLKVKIDTINDDEIKVINEELKIRLDKKMMSFYAYTITEDDEYILLPYGYGLKKGYKKRSSSEFPKIDVQFTGILRDEQIEVKNEAINILNQSSTLIIGMYTGGGKTCISINIACCIKLKTMIIVNKVILLEQWKESIQKFCPEAKIQVLKPKQLVPDKEADFYIINVLNIEKIDKDFIRETIGFLIVDELHLIMTEKFSQCLKYIEPRYLLGLSATSYRYDEFHILIDLYFGSKKIIRDMERNHVVFLIKTGVKIELIKQEETKKVDWNHVITEQSTSSIRNDLIVKIVQEFKDRNILIICKRVHQGNILLKKLRGINENVDSLIGKKQEFDTKCRILVGIHSKISTGFDWDILDTLILAVDLKAYYIQSLGRVFRRKDTIPFIFELLDENIILTKHYLERKEVYNKIGATFKKLSL